ncbi:MAG: hypothetical protein L7G90_03035 [Candidatus Nanopusillus sp.]|nr:hypothetical protein [Candidatus Nanopusillus sp.]
MSELGTAIAAIGIGGIAIVALILEWIIITIPVYLAAKLFGSDASFSRAMGAVLLSEIVSVIIIIFFVFISIVYKSFILGISGLIIDFIAVLGVYKSMFNVGWGAAFGIIIVSIIIVIIFNMILSFFGINIFPLPGGSQLQSFLSPLFNLTNIFHGFNLG